MAPTAARTHRASAANAPGDLNRAGTGPAWSRWFALRRKDRDRVEREREIVSAPWLVVGLGNPGPAYADNRHNAGAMVVDLLAARLGASFKAFKGRADVATANVGGERVVLAKPRSYMNLSGGPVAARARLLQGPPRPSRGRPRRARPAVWHVAAQARGRRQRSQRAAVASAGRSAVRSTSAYGSASADRPAGWIRPRTCSGTSMPCSDEISTSTWSAPQTRSRASYSWPDREPERLQRVIASA